MTNEKAEKKSGNAVMQSIKEGAGWDVTLSVWALSHGIPIPPSIVKRVRVGVGRLIDGGFGVAGALIDNVQEKYVFDGERRRATVLAVSEAGTQKLIDSDEQVTELVARSYLNEHKLKLNNRTNVVRAALDQIGRTSFSDNEATEDEAEIELDWLNHFSEIAGQKSTPEMQLLFGKILAGEIRQPGSFSPMSINVLANLTPAIAQKFEKLCSVSITFATETYISLDMFPEFLRAGIPELPFEYGDLLLLRQYQLLAIENGTKLELPLGKRAGFSIAGRKYALRALPMADDENGIREFVVASFSSVGNELRTLIEPSPPDWLDGRMDTAFARPAWVLEKFPVAQ